MVERSRRLRRSYEVRHARSQGRPVAHGPLVARILRHAARAESNRYAVIAGKKVGGSVERNRLKRLVREAIRRLDPSLKPGHDIVIVVRGRLDEMPTLAVAEQTLSKICQRAGIVAKPQTGQPDQADPASRSQPAS